MDTNRTVLLTIIEKCKQRPTETTRKTINEYHKIADKLVSLIMRDYHRLKMKLNSSLESELILTNEEELLFLEKIKLVIDELVDEIPKNQSTAFILRHVQTKHWKMPYDTIAELENHNNRSDARNLIMLARPAFLELFVFYKVVDLYFTKIANESSLQFLLVDLQ